MQTLSRVMNIVITPTVDDGSIRAAAILQTQSDLYRALISRSSQLNEVASLTLVQTNVGVRTLRSLVDDLARHGDAGARLAALVEQSRGCGLLSVSEGMRVVARGREQMRRAAGSLPTSASQVDAGFA